MSLSQALNQFAQNLGRYHSKDKLSSIEMPIPSHISLSLINNMSTLRYLFANVRYLSVNTNQTLHVLICNYRQ